MSKINLAALITLLAALVTIMSLIIIPSSQATTSCEPPHRIVSQELVADQNNDEPCEGPGKEDCLIRRTLQAHTDYVYTCDNPTEP
ncbi:phytosulfokines-like [Cucumis sativus]|uniref:phytosulfokines-like n=1 Tax=Cucumis sativus TaxID=3659 RepID=UPI0012F525E9|nr:phytosulfokines-like [Cucumis sativus]KAE8653250.1 hypothetical protein Csa_020040 [Cucumis sativus]